MLHLILTFLILLLLQHGDLIADAQPPRTTTLTPQDCQRGFLSLQYRTDNFERFPIYFRDDSVYTLAQAGSYVGAEDIEEYVRFGTKDSPYVLKHSGSSRLCWNRS